MSFSLGLYFCHGRVVNYYLMSLNEKLLRNSVLGHSAIKTTAVTLTHLEDRRFLFWKRMIQSDIFN